MSERKKIIPKFKKKLQGFLSDESGKITKEDVLGMGLITMGLVAAFSPADPVNAAHFSQCAGHGSAAGTHGNSGIWYRDATTNSSLLVQGHANYVPAVTFSAAGHGNGTGLASHANHVSHIAY